MRYYIQHKGTVFTTHWFDIENNYEPGMIVIDTLKGLYYMGGEWIEVIEDSL